MNISHDNNKSIDANKLYEDGKKKTQELYQEGKEKAENTYEKGKDKAEDLYHKTADSASDLYQAGKKKIGETQDCLSSYSDEFIQSIKSKPLSSLLIAGGIGFILSVFLKK